MTVRSAVWAGVALVAIGLGGLIFTGVAGATGIRSPWTQGQTAGGRMDARGGAGGGGMMGGGGAGGGGMMGGGGAGGGGMMGGAGYGGMMGGQGAARIGNARLVALVARGKVGARIDAKTDTVTYVGLSPTIVALASPHGQPNMTWEIDGLVNPTVVVRPGARITVDLVNTDWGYMHGLEITTTPPPYPYMATMGIANHTLLMPLPPRTSKDLAAAQYSMRVGAVSLTPGTYYYLCPVPGHAQSGMYGVISVRA